MTLGSRCLGGQGTPDYRLEKHGIPDVEAKWRAEIESRMDKMYTEFKNANSNIAELLQYVKRGVAFDRAEASEAPILNCNPRLPQLLDGEVATGEGLP